MTNPASQRRLTHKKRKADVAAKQKLKEGPTIADLQVAHRRREMRQIRRGETAREMDFALASVASAFVHWGSGGINSSGVPMIPDPDFTRPAVTQKTAP